MVGCIGIAMAPDDDEDDADRTGDSITTVVLCIASVIKQGSSFVTAEQVANSSLFVHGISRVLAGSRQVLLLLSNQDVGGGTNGSSSLSTSPSLW